jgi:uncharacterized Zn finger protein
VSAEGVCCPFCGSREVEVVSAWGGQLITSQLRCRACASHFEAIRGDFDGADERPAQA